MVLFVVVLSAGAMERVDDDNEDGDTNCVNFIDENAMAQVGDDAAAYNDAIARRTNCPRQNCRIVVALDMFDIAVYLVSSIDRLGRNF